MHVWCRNLIRLSSNCLSLRPPFLAFGSIKLCCWPHSARALLSCAERPCWGSNLIHIQCWSKRTPRLGRPAPLHWLPESIRCEVFGDRLVAWSASKCILSPQLPPDSLRTRYSSYFSVPDIWALASSRLVPFRLHG